MQPSPAQPSTPKRLAIVLGVTALLLVGGEFIARAAFPPPTGYHVYPPGLRKVFSPKQGVMPGVSGDAHFAVNSIGLRGDDEPEGEPYRILAVGGSTTECAYLDQPLTWPELLEAQLSGAQGPQGPGVWIANAGRSGFTSRRHVVQLRHLLPQAPSWDLVVLLVGVNDLAKRLEYGDDAPDPSELGSATVPVTRAFTEVPADASGALPFYKRLGLWRMTKALQGKLTSSALEQDAVGKKYVKWRLLRHRAGALRETLPDLDEALAAYTRNIEECIELARAHDVRLVLVNQPSMWRADLPEELHRLLWLGGIGDYQHDTGCDYYTVDALARGMALYNEALERVAAEHDIEFVDIASALPRDTTAFYDDVHFNEGGAERVASTLAEHLLERAPFATLPDPDGH